MSSASASSSSLTVVSSGLPSNTNTNTNTNSNSINAINQDALDEIIRQINLAGQSIQTEHHSVQPGQSVQTDGSYQLRTLGNICEIVYSLKHGNNRFRKIARLTNDCSKVLLFFQKQRMLKITMTGQLCFVDNKIMSILYSLYDILNKN